ncbi:MAG: zinc-binding dehydrogenase [Candidatus Eremiobacteraeota bacterium]|nr:zinc-binding dehydrogenase [Candidatus Eremiobacteraeota bacterium]MBV8365669.1 zinc-binding dehydrogenase [Candidatus Eremiobacteraeota bacterium]
MLPTTTKAAVYQRGGDVAVRDVALSPLRDGELLVRITACGICSSETLQWYADRKAPFVLGHEPVAVIEACGTGAAPLLNGVAGANGMLPFAPGERVFVHHHAPCMQCRRCRRRDYVQCETWRSSKLQPGAMAQFAIVPVESVRADVLRVPDSLDDDLATLIEPLATVVKSVRRSRLRAGDRVLVIGLGTMGMLHLALARFRGAEVLMGADRVASRLDAARTFGAHHAFDIESAPLHEQVAGATDGEGADIVIVCPGSIAAMQAAAQCVAPGGTVVLFTPAAATEYWPLPVHDLFFKDVSVVASYSAGPDDTREALTLLADGLPVRPLVTHRFGLDSIAQAYRLVAAGTDALKVIVYPGRS